MLYIARIVDVLLNSANDIYVRQGRGKLEGPERRCHKLFTRGNSLLIYSMKEQSEALAYTALFRWGL